MVVSPSTFGYEERITSVVSDLGHDVRWHDERVGNDFVSKAITRLRLLWLLPRLKKDHVAGIIKEIEKHNIEILLLINPETLLGKDLARIKQIAANIRIIIYKWDSLAQKPIDEVALEVADRVYSFDPEDCRANGLLTHLPLFHSHAVNKMANEKPAKPLYEFVFVGTAQWHRVRVLAKLIQILRSQERSFYFYLVSQSAIHHVIYKIAAMFYGYNGSLKRESLSYDEYLQAIEKSLCVVDIEYPNQTGLTMRSIEVLFSKSSIMTTNTSIREYCFFDIGGVFVFNEDDMHLPSRADLEQKKNSRMFSDYSIRTWVSSLLMGQGGLSWDGRRWCKDNG